jgi:hypothetical protein
MFDPSNLAYVQPISNRAPTLNNSGWIRDIPLKLVPFMLGCSNFPSLPLTHNYCLFIVVQKHFEKLHLQFVYPTCCWLYTINFKLQKTTIFQLFKQRKPPNREKERTEKREGIKRIKLETHSNTTVVGFGI